ncbi:class I SAM-dependent methyltransferase [Candidatus Woesearchaeota archaeon]|nr:class I SAM-dependent methyltransferase [Candidatus Woesearchaeota archaeon]
MLKIKYSKKVAQILANREQDKISRKAAERVGQRHGQFRQIKEEYSRYHRELLRQGRLPVKSTEKGFWGVSVCDEVFELFQKIGLSQYRNFIDLGSGDGRVVLIASLFTNATGVECDQELLSKSIEIKHKLGLSASFLKEDFYKHGIAPYDMVFSFPDEPLYRGLDAKLRKELQGRLIVYGPFLNTTKLQREASVAINGNIFHLYKNYS